MTLTATATLILGANTIIAYTHSDTPTMGAALATLLFILRITENTR